MSLPEVLEVNSDAMELEAKPKDVSVVEVVPCNDSQDEAPSAGENGSKAIDGDGDDGKGSDGDGDGSKVSTKSDDSKDGGGEEVTLATILRRMTDLEQKLREMEKAAKIAKKDDDDAKSTTSDEGKDKEDKEDKSGDSDGTPFGSINTTKIIPQASEKTMYSAASEAGVKSHAIIAQYEIPPSWEGDVAKLGPSDVKGPPLNITINSPEIISLLKTVSGTTLRAEPVVMLPPYKILVSQWDDIKEKLKKLEDAFREEHGTGAPEELEAAKEEKSEEPGVLNEEESRKREEAEEKRKKHREIVFARCLVTFIRTFLKDILDLRTSIQDRTIEKIRFDDLWHLYNPGDIIVKREQGELQAYQIISVTKGRRKLLPSGTEEKTWMDARARNSLRIQCYSMAYNGEVIDKIESIKLITPYEGAKKITDLAYCPLPFHEAASAGKDGSLSTTATLMERGLKFLRHRYGQGSCDTVSSRPIEHVEGQIFVDFKTGYEEDFEKPELGTLKLPEYSTEETYETTCTIPKCTTCSNSIYEDEQLDVKRAEAVLNKLPGAIPEAEIDALIVKLEKQIKDEGEKDSEEDAAALQQVLLLQHEYLVFALRTKRWHLIDIKDFEPDQVTDEDRRQGFDNLVIDKVHKRLLLAIVNDHAASGVVGNGKAPQRAGRSIDITPGKGNGRIIFLYGPPGVGKTSTAETIAMYNKPARPLYPITCGDLGSNPTDIENNLKKHFKLAYRWNCVLLLDEADVYLAARHHSDLNRNEIVSVFLRTLEYYSGLLFLTSNREGSIDHAFKSRIHLALHYRRIDLDGTEKIWRNMLAGIEKDNLRPDRAIKVEFDKDELINWARKHYDSLRASRGSGDDDEGVPTWNGRQIRNAFHSALALASYDRSEAIQKQGLTAEEAIKKKRFKKLRLGSEHFDDISSVVKVFERYLIQCGKSEQNAEREGLRYDDFGEQPQTPEPESRAIGGSSRRQAKPARSNYAEGPYDEESDEESDRDDEDEGERGS